MQVRFPTEHRQDPTKDAGQRISYAPVKRAAFRGRWYVLLILVLSPVAFLLWQISKDEILVQANGILTTEPIILRASQSGFVDEVSLAPGSRVAYNQSIVSLSSPEMRATLDILKKSRAELLAAQQETHANILEILGGHAEALEQARIAQAEIRESYRKLEQKELMTNVREIQLNTDERELGQQIVENKLAFENAQSRFHSEGVASTIREIELEIATLNIRKGLLKIRAVVSGTVNKVFVAAGEYVSEGDIIAELSNYEKPVVNVFLEPKRMAFAVMGNSATIIFPDGSRHSGVISEPVQITETIPAALAGPFEGTKTAVKVVLSFESPPATWIEGLPVQVRFKRREG